MRTLNLDTSRREQLVDITASLHTLTRAAEVREGVLVAFVPHTTAGITINENADPSVRADLTMAFDHLVPESLPFTHAEGNSDGHTKSSLVGSSVTLIIHEGRLQLGTWQAVYFAEFDGPRHRRVLVTLIPEAA